MPVRHDFTCEKCGHTGTYWNYVCAPPSHCGERMTWTPKPGSFAIDARESFEETTVESGGRTFKVDSLHAMRKIEKTTEQMARNKEGQPLVWRDYAQDQSNRDQHTLATHLDRPVTGYAEGTTGVDATKFQKRVGDAVVRDHGEA